MCPACVSGMVWVAASVGSAGGLGAWALKWLLGKSAQKERESMQRDSKEGGKGGTK